MNSLFEGFDLTDNTSKAKKTPAKKKQTEAQKQLAITNQQLFSDCGEDFVIELNKPRVDVLLGKLSNTDGVETKASKVLKSNALTLEEKLEVIRRKVLEVLGKQKKNVIVIKTKEEFEDYISKAIEFGRIAVDTETNNSLDPVTCKLMGLCLYAKGQKQAYIPINHRDPISKERLAWQLTEEDCMEQLQRVLDTNTFVVMHNGKFDYEVINCTCNIKVKPDWDTMVAARLLDENELAGLKWQYINKIDPTQAKYDIEHLFENVAYADVEPEIFALYAARDAGMTDELYEIQKEELDKPEYGPHIDIAGKHEVKGLRWVFENVEMPIVVVTAEMELAGVKIDTAFGERLKAKYTNNLAEVDKEIEEVLKDAQKIIAEWKLTPAANAKTRTYVPKKTKMTEAKIEKQYPNVDEKGLRYKISKAKAEQIDDPINLASPIQLAILFYDIFGCPAVSSKSPRGTGKDELEALDKKLSIYLPKKEIDLEEEIRPEDFESDFEVSDDTFITGLANTSSNKFQCAAKLCSLILKRRGILKLITTYIDVIPELVKHWPDGRIRFHLSSLGTDTGRYSSGGKLKFMENEEAIEVGGINIQQVPAKNPEIRMLFTADTKEHVVECTDNYYEVSETDEVETTDGWKYAEQLSIGDRLPTTEGQDIVKNIVYVDKKYFVYV